MKAILLMTALMFSSMSYACECAGPGPKDADPVIVTLLKKAIAPDVILEIDPVFKYVEKKQLRAYPTVMDRLALMSGFRGTSCHTEGPNGEDLYHCSTSYKSDYEVPVKLVSGKECKAIIRVKATKTKAKAKLLTTNC